MMDTVLFFNKALSVLKEHFASRGYSEATKERKFTELHRFAAYLADEKQADLRVYGQRLRRVHPET